MILINEKQKKSFNYSILYAKSGRPQCSIDYLSHRSSLVAASLGTEAGPLTRPSQAAPEDEVKSNSPGSHLVLYELSVGAHS